MSSTNLRDLLTSFNPTSDFFAVASADGRIKIWDTLKSQLQTEFADIAASPSDDALGVRSERESGHLAFDYRCMKWVQLQAKKKKKKVGSSLLALGTGNGDVLALDVSLGQLNWKVRDCHPGGVTAISFNGHNSCIYTAGVDGMVCQIDSSTGNMVGKFKSSRKAISALSISADGRLLATAAAQLKIFNCLNNKKIQKLSGHAVAIRCMIFSEDGKYILSSAVGERYIAIWKMDGGKKQSASCVLSLEHPAVVLDAKGSDTEGSEVTALDRANAEDATLPLPKLYVRDKKRKHGTPPVIAESEKLIDPVLSKNKTWSAHAEGYPQEMAEDGIKSMGDKLRAAGILGGNDNLIVENRSFLDTSVSAPMQDSTQFSVDADASTRKIRRHILSMSPGDAYKLLEILVSSWKARSAVSKHALAWIYTILVIHGQFIMSQESSKQLMGGLQKMTRSRCVAIHPLLNLSGRLQLSMDQIDKAGLRIVQTPSDEHDTDHSEDEEEDEDEDVEELVYGEEDDESQSSSDDDN